MNLVGSVALVTGANRGIGKQLVLALVAAGATKVYVAARQLSSAEAVAALDPAHLVPVVLNVRDLDQALALAARCPDVSLLVNNAGVNLNSRLIGSPDVAPMRTEFETNFFGTLYVSRAFAPVLARNGGGALVNLGSILGRVSMPVMGSLCASKAAVLSLTQGIRGELASQGTHVMAVLPGPVDTDMSAGYQGPKTPPAEVAQAIVAGLQAGVEEVYPGEFALGVSAGLAADPKAVEKQFAAYA